MRALHVHRQQAQHYAGSLQPSRSPPACGPGASWAAAPIETPAAVINNVVRRGRVVGCPLIATDGSLEYYLGAVARLFGSRRASMVKCSRHGGTIVLSGSSAA